MNKPRTYLTEFPDYGELPFPVPKGWTDASWHDDVCPSLECGGAGEGRVFRMWLDYEDPARRELSGPRFILEAQTTVSEMTFVLATEDPVLARVALALVALRREVRDWQEALGGEREGLDGLCAEIDALLKSE